jgi:hypothetical protein
LAASSPVAAATVSLKPAVMGMRNLPLLDTATASQHPAVAGMRCGAYPDMTPMEIFWDTLTNGYLSAPSLDFCACVINRQCIRLEPFAVSEKCPVQKTCLTASRMLYFLYWFTLSKKENRFTKQAKKQIYYKRSTA